jgi:hypothetical protein
MVYLIVVYSLAMIGFLVVTSLIALLVISLWHDVNFTVSNKKGKDGE